MHAAKPIPACHPVRPSANPRAEFIAEQAAARADRALRGAEVRSRAADLEACRQQAVSDSVLARERRRAEDLARQAKLKAERELFDRWGFAFRTFSGTIIFGKWRIPSSPLALQN